MSVRLAILGDSIAYGQGAARPSDRLGARLAADLNASGTPTELRILAVPGARSAALAAQVRRAVSWRPDVALIDTAANDLPSSVPPAQAAGLLGDAVRALRSAGSRVVVAPAPDMSVLPMVPEQFRAVVRAGSGLLRQAQTRAALAEGARVADVEAETSASFAADPSLFSADRFHPSSAGYAVIARALAPAVFAAVSEVVEQTG
jgi:lysophospholipase L1-like esterase